MTAPKQLIRARRIVAYLGWLACVLLLGWAPLNVWPYFILGACAALFLLSLLSEDGTPWKQRRR